MEYIKNVDKYLNPYKNLDKITIAKVVKQEDLPILQKLGFTIPLVQNEAIVPNPINRLTLENIEGKCIIRKDLSQDEPYEQTIHWKTVDWGGHEHYGYSTIIRYRYRREYAQAFNVEFIIRKNSKEEYYVCSNIINVAEKDKIKFIINLFLSIFRDFLILDEKLNGLVIKKLNFTFLRPGILSREKLREILDKRKKQEPIENSIVLDRFDFLNQYNDTDTIMVGHQGFYGYYAIKTKRYWVVECNFMNNATYLFDDKWEQYVQLTKQQVINGGLCVKRVYHNSNWESEMSRLLN